jgi:hypothetical protein
MGANVILVHPNPSDPRLTTVAEFIDILSYKDILTATEISASKVNAEALSKRKDFLSSIVSKSVNIGKNIIGSPDTDEFKRVKRKSIFMAGIYHLGIKAIFRVGLANEQMKKVYNFSS